MSTTENEKRKANDQRNRQPLKVIRVGAIAASVWRRQTPTGFEYLDFSLSRSWKLKSGEKEGYSQNFFENNEEALFEVINEASRFIREHELHANLTVQSRLAPSEEPSAEAA